MKNVFFTLAVFFLIIGAGAIVATSQTAQEASERSIHPWSLGWRDERCLLNVDFNEGNGKCYNPYVQNTGKLDVRVYGGILSNEATKGFWDFSRGSNYSYANGTNLTLCFWLNRGATNTYVAPDDAWLWGNGAWWVGCDTAVEATTKLWVLWPGNQSQPSSSTSTLGTWEHWAITYSATPSPVVNFYKNGTWDGSSSGGMSTTTYFWYANTGYLIGSGSTWSQYDDIMFFNRVLTSNEIVRIYREGLNVK